MMIRSDPARRWAVDTVIALAVTAAQVGGAYGWHHHGADAGAATYIASAAAGVSLIARRRYPVGVLAVTLAATLWAAAASRDAVWFALVAAFFNAVLAGRRAAALASLVVGFAVSVWPPWLIGRHGHTSAASALGLGVLLVCLLSVAEVIRIRNQRAAALQRSREEELRRLASEERMRMARDLHDVIAHSISVINVQANTALHLMDRQPERARSALTTINDVSRQALVELRSVLGVLRDAGETAPRAPSSGLSRLGDLADSAAAAGLVVHIEQAERPVPLPADVDLAAYRIVQEALTNTAKHSGGTKATVRVGYGDDTLVIEVNDNGFRRPSGRGDDSGHGITGMTERAKALGGTLQAGPRPEGGFGVRARLPVRGSEP